MAERRKKRGSAALKRYHGDLKAIVKATGGTWREARSAWKSKAFTKDGKRVARKAQVKAHAAVRSDNVDQSETASVVDLYGILGDFGRRGFKIIYTSPGASGSVETWPGKERGRQKGEAVAQELKRTNDSEMDDYQVPGVSENMWRVEPFFLVEWNDYRLVVSVSWVGE